MIKTRYNRYIAYAAMVGFVGGFLVLFGLGIPPLIALLVPWSISAIVVLLTRCPQCGVIYGRNKSGFFGPALPKKCWECGYEYR